MSKKLIHTVGCLILFFFSFCGDAMGQSLIFRPGFVTVGDLVIEEAGKYIGTPYRWGGHSPKGFDCAGFVRYIYGMFGVSLSSGARTQYHQATLIKDEEMAIGDLVFFGGRTGSTKSVGHVGIVTSVDSNGFYFIHSSTTIGVCISSSREPYYSSRYIGAGRVMDRVVSNLPKGPVGIKKEPPVYQSGALWNNEP